MKILNIDAFAKVNRQITFGGKTYDVVEPNVQQFIDNLKAAEELEKSGGAVPLSQTFENAVKVIKEAIPTMDDATIRGLRLPAMTAVLQFIRGELDPEMPAGDQAASTDNGGETAKKQS